MFSLALTVQLEYINHLLQFFKNISYYAGIMLNAFSDLLCSNYAGIIGWSLAPTHQWKTVKRKHHQTNRQHLSIPEIE